MTDIKILNSKEEYENFINEDKVIVKFSATWCSPCKVLSSIINRLDNDRLNGYKFGEVDVDEDFAEDITKNLNIRNVPVCIYFNNGKVVNRTVGIVKADDIYKNVSD